MKRKLITSVICLGASILATNALAIELKGVSSNGAPLTGDIRINVHGQDTNFKIDHTNFAGEYDFQTELRDVYVLEADGSAGGEYRPTYSFVHMQREVEHYHVNINPITELILARVTGAKPEDVYKNYLPYYVDLISSEKYQNAKDDVAAFFGPLMLELGIDPSIDFVADEYPADHTGVSAMLDMLTFKFYNDKVHITYKGDEEIQALSYDGDWSNKTFDSTYPAPSDVASVIPKADEILERMIKINGLDRCSELYSDFTEQAVLFGEDKEDICAAKNTLYGNEVSDMNRYYDFKLLEINGNYYKLSYMAVFEDAKYSSGEHGELWFHLQPNGLKLQGNVLPWETNTKTYSHIATKVLVTQGSNSWGIEIGVEIAPSFCETITQYYPDWDYSDFDFSKKLPKTEDIGLPFTLAVVSGPGYDGLNLNRVYKQVEDGETIGCYLASSQEVGSPIIEVLPFDVNPEDVPSNPTYQIHFYNNGHFIAEETRKLGKVYSSSDELEPLLPKVTSYTHDYHNFSYKWSNDSGLTKDLDLWTVVFWPAQVFRTALTTNDGEVKNDDWPYINNARHLLYDNHRRVIINETRSE